MPRMGGRWPRRIILPASERAAAAARSISKKTAAHVTSRKRREIASIDFGINLLQNSAVLTTWGKVLFKFFVPGELIASCYMRRQFCQLLRRQPISGLFDFRKTHGQMVVAASFLFNDG